MHIGRAVIFVTDGGVKEFEKTAGSMLAGLSDRRGTTRSAVAIAVCALEDRCYRRHGVSRLPDTEGDKPAKKAFKAYPIGYFHIDIAEVQTAQGKLFLFVAIDRTSKFAFAKLAEKANRMTASAFLTALIKAVPYKIHTVLTDNGIQFTLPQRRGEYQVQ